MRTGSVWDILLRLRGFILIPTHARKEEGVYVGEGVDTPAKMASMVNEGVCLQVPGVFFF